MSTSERYIWLDRAVTEAAVVTIVEETGWVRDADRPRTLYRSRQLRWSHPESAAKLYFDAFVTSGCQTVSVSGDPDAATEAIWPRIEALPRYDRHVEDAASAEPARLMRGLRQWVIDCVLSNVRPPGLDRALDRARDHADPIVRACAADLAPIAERLPTSSS